MKENDFYRANEMEINLSNPSVIKLSDQIDILINQVSKDGLSFV